MEPKNFTQQLNAFIVRAKAATYIGDGERTKSSRPESRDLAYEESPFSYLDSYFGTVDFIGEEVVYFENQPVWAMNYYGRIIQPEKITGAEVGKILKTSLSEMYKEGRFLGGFEYTVGDCTYTDTSQGDLESFSGKEWITREKEVVYELLYHGGMIKS
jgi:hypothetical protein